MSERTYTSVEICAGAGGQAIGLHRAGFHHKALVELDPNACATLRKNVGKINSREEDVHELDLKLFTKGPKTEPGQYDVTDLGLDGVEVDLLAGGVPCPPFSFAGKQLGEDDERDLFPVMLDMVEALDPKAVMIENVRGLLEPAEKFGPYRESILKRLAGLGYTTCDWAVLEAVNFQVPQLRPRAILVAMKEPYARHFGKLPKGDPYHPLTVAVALGDTMRARRDALRGTVHEKEALAAYDRWEERAVKAATPIPLRGVAPTLVGGSKKHGGADLGPTRAKRAWAALGVNGLGVADENPTSKPDRHFLRKEGPMLTVVQAAIIQGFPSDWKFHGLKTAAYRQVGNAFPPPVAEAVAKQIRAAIEKGEAGVEPPARAEAPGKQLAMV